MLLLIALALLLQGTAAQFTAWRDGRASHYGDDHSSIDKGSCGYGWLDKSVLTGYDVAAISDQAPDYSSSCGKCKEVRCKPMGFADGYGQVLDRKDGICYNLYASVVVMITDTCPCHYPNNLYSNKRWCCNDKYHLDMSVWAYEKLASKKWGVIGVELRDVPCWYKPKTIAKLPSWTKPTPQPWWEKAPANWNKAMDRRIGNKFQYQNGKKTLEQHCGFNHVCAGFGSENVLCWTFGFLKDFLYFGQFQAATMFHSTSTYCCSCAWCGCE